MSNLSLDDDEEEASISPYISNCEDRDSGAFGGHDSGEFGGRESNTSQNSATTDESDRREPQFRRLTFLAQYFKKSRQSNGKIESKCLRCSRIIKTKELTRLCNHLLACRHISLEERSVIVEKFGAYTDSRPSIAEMDRDWAIVMIENNISFNSIESERFRRFVRKYLPSWRPPSRHRISCQIVPRHSERIANKFFADLRDSRESYITVEFDHWTDANHRSLLAVIMCYGEQGNRYLLGIDDVSREGHATAVIVEKLSNMLATIDPKNINAFISDSASTCKKAREDFVIVENYRHVLQHRCLAHLVNRIGEKVSSSSWLSDTMKAASRIASVASNNARLSSLIRESALRQVRPSGARWYADVEMISSLIAAKSVIVEDINSSKNADDKRIVTDEQFWSTLAKALKLLRPFADCIAAIERNDTSLGQALSHLLQVGRYLFKQDWSDARNLSAITAFLDYVCPGKLEDEFSLLLAAYILDVRNLANYLTEEAIVRALRAITDIASDSGATLEYINDAISPDYDNFTEQIETFDWQPEDSPISWWRKRDSRAIKDIALRLAHLKASSAGIERLFSTLKHIQGSQKFNLSLESLTNLGRIKIALLNRKIRAPRVAHMRDSGETEENSHCFDPKPHLLPPESAKNYRDFTQYFDYTIVRSKRARETSSQVDYNARAQIIRQFRNRRANRRAAAEALLLLESS